MQEKNSINENIQKFRELMLSDEEFQQKLQAASQSYAGEQNEETVFNEVLSPLAKEYGIDITLEEFREFLNSDHQMDDDEIGQIAGGKGGGFGGGACVGVGIGLGWVNGNNKVNSCCVIGAGNGDGAFGCAGEGAI